MIRKITEAMLPLIHTSSSKTDVLDQHLNARYDVCVIGSGPGGSVTASTLARAGLRVALLERGPFFPAASANFKVLDQSNRMGHLEMSNGYRTALYQGSGLGGGSLIYGGVAMQPKDHVFEEWRSNTKIDSLDRRALAPHFEHVRQVMSITSQEKVAENTSNAIVREMADKLGRPGGLDVVERYTEGCAGVGMCSLGCGFDLKGNMINSFLPLGLESGNLQIFTNCEAESLQGSRQSGGFVADGVGVVMRDFSRGTVIKRAVLKANLFVVAAGAFFSSALLQRTRELAAANRLIGAKVYLQPHAQVFALFDRPITKRGVLRNGEYIPGHGVPAIYNFNGFLADFNFFWLASILFPANLASFIANLAPDEHLEIMRRFHQTMSITITLRDNPLKSRVISEARPKLDYRESQADVNNLRMCLLQAARGFLAVGAKRVFLPFLRPPRIEREADLAQIEKLRFGFDEVMLYSDHTSGGNSMGANEQCGAADETGRIFGSKNVYAADSSLFPSAAGTNPSWTIMAMAHRVATGLAASHARKASTASLR